MSAVFHLAGLVSEIILIVYTLKEDFFPAQNNIINSLWRYKVVSLIFRKIKKKFRKTLKMGKSFPFNLMLWRTCRPPHLSPCTFYEDAKCSGLKLSSFKLGPYKLTETTHYLVRGEHLQRIAVSECHLLQGKMKAWTIAKDEPSQGTWLGSPSQSLDGAKETCCTHMAKHIN